MPINIEDIAGLSEPLKKLIEVVSKGLGNLTESYFIRKKADAKAYEISKISDAIIKTQGLVKSEYVKGDVILRQSEIILKRLAYQEAKKQANLVKITQFAADELEGVTEADKEPVDDDWITRFFKMAEDITSEEMQILWGKILAGEIKQPTTYSLRTLEFLRNLSKKDADIFVKVAKLAISSGDKTFLLNSKDLLKEYDIAYDDRLLLEELGLITANDLSFELMPAIEDQNVLFICGDKIVIVERKSGTPKQTMPVLVFTKLAKELLGLIKASPNIEYLKELAKNFKRDGVNISYALITILEKNMVHYDTPKELNI